MRRIIRNTKEVPMKKILNHKLTPGETVAVLLASAFLTAGLVLIGWAAIF